MYILWIVSSKMSLLNWTTGGVGGAADYHYKGSREEGTDYIPTDTLWEEEKIVDKTKYSKLISNS